MRDQTRGVPWAILGRFAIPEPHSGRVTKQEPRFSRILGQPLGVSAAPALEPLLAAMPALAVSAPHSRRATVFDGRDPPTADLGAAVPGHKTPELEDTTLGGIHPGTTWLTLTCVQAGEEERGGD